MGIIIAPLILMIVAAISLLIIIATGIIIAPLILMIVAAISLLVIFKKPFRTKKEFSKKEQTIKKQLIPETTATIKIMPNSNTTINNKEQNTTNDRKPSIHISYSDSDINQNKKNSETNFNKTENDFSKLTNDISRSTNDIFKSINNFGKNINKSMNKLITDAKNELRSKKTQPNNNQNSQPNVRISYNGSDKLSEADLKKTDEIDKKLEENNKMFDNFDRAFNDSDKNFDNFNNAFKNQPTQKLERLITVDGQIRHYKAKSKIIPDSKKNNTNQITYKSSDKEVKNNLPRKKLFHFDGTLMYEGNVLGDVKHGTGTTYYRNGNILSEGIYDNGSLVTGTIYSPNGFWITKLNNRKAIHNQSKEAVEYREKTSRFLRENNIN